MAFSIDNRDTLAPGGKGQVMPLLPLRDIIVFPHLMVPLFVGREKSVAALNMAMTREREIFLVAQRNAKTNDPKPEDIYSVGTVSTILQMLKLPDGTVKILIEGKKRARVKDFIPRDDFYLVELDEIQDSQEEGPETQALVRNTISAFEAFVKMNKKVPPEMIVTVAGIDDPSRLIDVISPHLDVKLDEKQKLLEIVDLNQRLETIFTFLQGEIEILQIERKIRGRVKKQMERTQKEYYLNEQMRAIQKELGRKDEFQTEITELENKIKQKKLSEEALDKTTKEMKKLKLMPPMSAEATVSRNYIDWILSLPWQEYTEDKIDLDAAEKILEEDHYGLKKVKERILEYLAVQKLVGKLKGPIICFAGPPGVGKTSLGKSIARATNRKFVRISLGGVRDEAEIRGHRRTYIGALPGKIIQSMKRAGSSNPVFLIDEVDKMSTDFRGDPSAALMEVLDPELNNSFNDHYLDLDYDLSKVMFICTANVLHSIPGPLQDRMEVIRLPGYTEEEKFHIAKRFLLPKQKEEHGLKDKKIVFSDATIYGVIRHYTKEAGVRNLERELANILRKVAKNIVRTPTEEPISITFNSLRKYLGIYKYRQSQKEKENRVGMSTGLAWTELGGEILHIEVTTMPGKGERTITGNLGDVMKESARAAMSYVRSRARALKLPLDFYQKMDI
ncbi:MAG: endopeptidase La, partial [Proteobacteria bacterium]|nr:endopeptidase La [Pseudomonadota bacterium]